METAYGRELHAYELQCQPHTFTPAFIGCNMRLPRRNVPLIKPVSSVRIYVRLIRLQNFTFGNIMPDEFIFDFTDNEVHAAGNFFKTYSFHV
jgi:hypothetical protein